MFPMLQVGTDEDALEEFKKSTDYGALRYGEKGGKEQQGGMGKPTLRA